MKNRATTSTQNGSIIVSILAMTLFITVIIYALLVLANVNLTRARGRILLLQAQYSAESGADAAIATLNSGNTAYTGTVSDVTVIQTSLYKSTYAVTVTAGADAKERIITATGKLYAPANASSPRYARTVEVLAKRTSSTTASSLMSRNIIATGSSVKDIKAKDIFANNYIVLNKNVNRLIAENITVAGRDTSSQNCSIGGSGSLVKPASFTTPGQTKTKLTLAYNNCINPPLNATTADFDVFPNLTNISKIQSTYIPWAQFMGATPTAGNCTAWTAASPSVAGHYPDTSSNISASCGTAGSVNLGSKTVTITDNVHLRADLCKSSICRPTFNNNSGSLKFVFVEGTINFEQVLSSAGSAPIVFVSYGADPGAHAQCSTYGDSIYLGQQGNNNTNAPAVYFLANNGVCLDGTKFAAAPALGGITGKNIFINTNSGNPFDLSFDVTFPTSSIPIDLSWKSARYRRL